MLDQGGGVDVMSRAAQKSVTFSCPVLTTQDRPDRFLLI